MKFSLPPVAAAILGGALSASWATLPGAPQANGLTPTIATLYVNGTNAVNDANGIYRPVSINNATSGGLGVSIADNGNVLVCWEDDGPPITNYTWRVISRALLGAWTMFNSQGASITPQTAMYSYYFGDIPVDPNFTLTNNYLNLFRTNNTMFLPYRAFLPAVAWGPKVHANLFGPGQGFGVVGNPLPFDDPETFQNYGGWGEFPVVQLLDSAGAPGNCVAGVTLDYAKQDNAAGSDIRIADWEYLANGNLVIVGESRQNANLTNLYGGLVSGNHAIYSIVTPTGAMVRTNASPCSHCPNALVYGTSLVCATNIPSRIWHGVGVTKDGFAVRCTFDALGGSSVRMFDNNGNPTTGDLILSTLTGHPETAGGGRGDVTGFHGNGKDAYVFAVGYGNGFWVTVLNTNGTVRWSRNVSDDLVVDRVGRGDAAITPAGEVVVVYSAGPDAGLQTVVLGRLFDAAGNPKGGTFYVSEKEVPDLGSPPAAASNPRVSYRGGAVAIVWQSKNYSYMPGIDVVAQRYFALPPTLSVSSSGGAVTVSWPTDLTGYALQASASLAPASWNPVPGVVNNSLTTNNPAGTVFYRLKR